MQNSTPLCLRSLQSAVLRQLSAAAVLCCLLLLLCPLTGLAANVTVTVTGIKGKLYTNVMARLKIGLQQNNPDISAGEIRRLHTLAAKEIAEALAPFGYYRVKVDGTLTETDKGWQARYSVDAGRQVVVDVVDIQVQGEGKTEAAFQHPAAMFPLHPGDVLIDSLYESGKKKLLDQAVNLGYVQARFSRHLVVVRRANQTAAVRLTLDTGPLYRFGAVTGSQESITPELFQRFITFHPGDVYSLKELNQLQSDLYGTGYFSEVLVEPKLSLARNEEIPITVTMLPAKVNRYSLGAGYGTDTGVRGNLGWKNRLLNRFGHKTSLTMQQSERGSRVNADYEIPVFDPRYDVLGIEGRYFDDTWDDTWSRLFSLGIAANHNMAKNQYGAGLEARHEKYTVGITSGSADLLMPSAYWNLIFARDRINTQNGIRLTASVKGADNTLFSSTSFLQFRVSGKSIVSPMENWRILLRGAFGATTMESINELPPSLRFYAGGDQSVRGYGYKKLGPRDPSGVVVGGRYLMESSIELERRITPMWSVAAFYDAGNAFDDINVDLKHGAGVGVRMTLPFGQIRLDAASALSDEGKPWRIHFSVGADL